MEKNVVGTYEKAVAQGVDAASRPAEGVAYEQWATRRDAVDRPATCEIQALLIPMQSNRKFIGIMGIDLGVDDPARDPFTLAGHTVVCHSGMVVFEVSVSDVV